MAGQLEVEPRRRCERGSDGSPPLSRTPTMASWCSAPTRRSSSRRRRSASTSTSDNPPDTRLNHHHPPGRPPPGSPPPGPEPCQVARDTPRDRGASAPPRRQLASRVGQVDQSFWRRRRRRHGDQHQRCQRASRVRAAIELPGPARRAHRAGQPRAVQTAAGAFHSHRRGDAVNSVLYLDFDDFKRINDTLGHQAGDAFLVAMGERLVAVVRPEDTVARLGGDEFAVLLDGADTGAAVAAAKRVLSALQRPLRSRARTWRRAPASASPRPPRGRQARRRCSPTPTSPCTSPSARARPDRVFSAAMRTDLLDRLQLGEDLRATIEAGASRSSTSRSSTWKAG